MYHVIAAQLPTEPAVVAAYALLVGFVGLVWVGNRRSGRPQSSEDGGSTAGGPATAIEGGDASAEGRPSSRPRKLTKAQRRRRGHIDWIQ